MTDKQYEELCRYFVACHLGIDIAKVVSIRIPNPKREDLPQYKHQIDLYWEIEDGMALYLNIANAKWRGSSKLEQGDVLKLQQVKQKVAAHKAVMITNSEFTSGAIAAAKDDGIALHIVRPDFDYSELAPIKANLIQQQIQTLAASAGKPLYFHEVVHKGFDLADAQNRPLPTTPAPIATPIFYGTGAMPSCPDKAITSVPNKAIGGSGSGGQRGQGFDGGHSKGSGGPGYQRK
jgi:hypothetical protein